MNRKSATNQEREGEKVMKKRKDKRAATAERKRAKKEKPANNN